MDEICQLVTRATEARAARGEKNQAFAALVRRFQDFAFACAYARLGDFHLAEDAAQEAFLSAWRNLDQLRKPEAFPGWFKRIVFTQCDRLTRNKQHATVMLDAVGELPAALPEPAQLVEQRERQAEVLGALQALPEHERLATLLYYIGDYDQREIAAFLEVPVSTIKKRLYSARQRLRERMTIMVRDTLQQQRPSRNEQFAETVALFNEALDSFVAKVKQDRYIIAAVLFGSLSHDTVWRKSDIDIILVGREEKPTKEFYLVENGVNIHAVLYSRSNFKKLLEGTLQGAFMHSAFALSTLLFTTDDTIRAYYDNVRSIGSRDRQMRLMTSGQGALYTLAKAEKWLLTRNDVEYSFLWIMFTIQNLASIEVLLHGEVTSREVIPQALKLNPLFFQRVYTDLINQPKDIAIIQRALDMINTYMEEKIVVLFGPVLEFLHDEGGVRTTTDLDAYFRKQTQVNSLSNIYEWLSDKGIIQKVPSPTRLTPRSQVEVDEAAYYFDGELPAQPTLDNMFAQREELA